VLDIPAWEFYVVATEVLNRELPDAKSVSLSQLQKLTIPCNLESLKAAVDSVLAKAAAASE
jgi:hypothetical protein